MEELKEIWKSIDSHPTESRSINAQEVSNTLGVKSIGTMNLLSKRILQKLVITVVLTMAFVIAVPFVSPLASQRLIALLTVVYGAGSIVLAIEYCRLNKDFDMSQHILKGLKAYHLSIARVLRFEEVLSLIMYPVSISAGFLFGMRLVTPHATVLDKPVQWVILGVSILILSFLGNRTTKWLNKRAFGEYMNRLDNNIKELEAVEEADFVKEG